MLEATNALLVAERRKRIAAACANPAVGILRRLPIQTDAETADQAGRQTLELARQHALSIYDAAYLEPRAAFGCRTCDSRRFAQSRYEETRCAACVDVELKPDVQRELNPQHPRPTQLPDKVSYQSI